MTTGCRFRRILLVTGFRPGADRPLGHADPSQHHAHHHRLRADRHRPAHRDGGDRLRHRRHGADHRRGACARRKRAQRAVDPIPSALVVTAIVIGFSVTAVMLCLRGPPLRRQEDALHRRVHGIEMVAVALPPAEHLPARARRRLRHSAALPARQDLAACAASVWRSRGIAAVSGVSLVGVHARRADDRGADRRRRCRRSRSICASACGRASSRSASISSRCSARCISGIGCAATTRALLLYLILVMGINGMVMTRDLFNLFVFLEIVSIATYGLLGLDADAGGACGRLQIHHGDGARLDVLPARHGAALSRHRHAQYRRPDRSTATEITGPIGDDRPAAACSPA